MAIPVFLQAVVRRCLFFAALAILAAPAPRVSAADTAETPEYPMTPRQSAIMRELASFRPPGVATTDRPWMLGRWDTDGELAELTRLPTGPGNAAAKFKALEDLHMEANAFSDREVSLGGRGADILLEAAEMAECRLSPDYYPPFDRLGARQPDFLVLRSGLRELLKRADELEKRGDIAGAERCHQAALVCGRHLTDDRPSSVVFLTGVIFKLRGAQAYEAFLLRSGQPDRAAAARRFAQHIGEILRLYYWKANVALNEMEGFACLPSAIAIARGDAEPCWRQEAVIRLAIMRHGAVGGQVDADRIPAYIQAAEDALARVAANDPEPTVRRLAVWAALNVRPEDGAAGPPPEQ